MRCTNGLASTETGRHPKVTTRSQEVRVISDLRDGRYATSSGTDFSIRAVLLATPAEALDERAVTVDVRVGEVAEQTAALANQQEQATTRVVVVLVLLEVLREVLDAL